MRRRVILTRFIDASDSIHRPAGRLCVTAKPAFLRIVWPCIRATGGMILASWGKTYPKTCGDMGGSGEHKDHQDAKIAKKKCGRKSR
jgi:hypothetical protein